MRRFHTTIQTAITAEWRADPMPEPAEGWALIVRAVYSNVPAFSIYIAGRPFSPNDDLRWWGYNDGHVYLASLTTGQRWVMVKLAGIIDGEGGAS